MSHTSGIRIDVDAKFPHLPYAPIVEAVIQWQAAPSKVPEQTTLLNELHSRFTDYSTQLQHGIETALRGSSEGMEVRQKAQWDGFRLISKDQKHICQFKPNSVVFSRLAPYDEWPQFVMEASRFWTAFVDLAAPVTIERIGVRFISRIQLRAGEQLAELVEESPGPFQSIGISSDSFFRQNTAPVPDYAYSVNIVRAIQQSQPPKSERSLIVDIDVATTNATRVEEDVIARRLGAMRFLKNKMFFTYVKNAEALFGSKQ